MAEEWQKTEAIRPYVKLDQWVIMPNHFHGIIVITHDSPVETPRGVKTARPVGETPRGVETSRRDVSTIPRLKPRSIGAIMGQFKSICTKRIWATGFGDFGWQSRFYDHITRNEESLWAIRQYIRDNPAKWGMDRDNPDSLYM